MALSGVAALKPIRWRHLTTPAIPQPVGGAPPRKSCQQQPTNRQWVRVAPPAGPRRVVQSLALFSDDCEQIGSFSSSFFLLQQVSSRGVSLLSWPAVVGSLQRLPSSLTQKLRQARVLDSRSFSPTEFVFPCPAGMLIGPDSRPLALRASESRAPSKLPGFPVCARHMSSLARAESPFLRVSSSRAVPLLRLAQVYRSLEVMTFLAPRFDDGV